MHTTHAPFNSAVPQAKLQPSENAILNWCLFWLPTLLIMLVIVVPDFESRHAQSAGGVEVESDLVATMATENSLRENVFFLSLLALGCMGATLFLYAGRSGGRPGSIHLWIILATLAYAVCSLMWADDRTLSFRRLVVTGFFVIGAWGVGRAWRPRQLVHMVFILSALFAISGILAEIYYGTFLAAGGYRFSGLLHPNRQALSCGLFVLAAMTMKAKTGNYLFGLLAVIGFGLLIMTGSRGGAAACALALAFQFFVAAPSSQRVAWGLFGGLLVGGGLLFLALEPNGGRRLETLAKMGRSDALSDPKSLTGRIPIWSEVVVGIQESPVVGHGYAAYWTPERIYRLSYIHNWEFNNAHSSYLEMMLSLGIVGFTLGMTSVLSVFARGLQLNAHAPDLGLVFILSVFVMAFISGLVESIFVSTGYEFLVWSIGA
ncbi:MAG: O-antigen ligase family protein, partial [Planctomycetales bacterium]|nr:O-antigen ligase family protein [Planctomycetales bacterium]